VIRVLIPSILESYTAGAREVTAAGATLAEVLSDLDARYPGLRFRVIDEQERIRPHIKVFVGEAIARGLDVALSEGDTVQLVGALSGG
jgi:molybdopterin converting factor small subunit